MNRIAGAVLAAGLLCTGTAVAFAAPQTALVRGTIESVNAHTLAVKTYAGKTEHLQLNKKTGFASIVPSHLDKIKHGEFVGIAATGSTDKLKALEVVIFPNSMRGMGEGHYPWSMPSAVAAADRHETAGMPTGAPPVQGTMTNGTVTSATPVNVGPPVQGTMTNGTVTGSSGVTGGTTFTISYSHGKHVNITVAAGAPVVRFIKASPAVAIVGAKTFVVATKASNGTLTADFVAVGKDGLMPPM